MQSAAIDARAIPAAVRALLEALRRAGHPTYLVGRRVRHLRRGRGVADFDVATRASPEELLAIFARAVPTGLRHGTVMVPTPAGPVDATSFRGGPKLEDDLAHRDFTINALAYEPSEERLVDPFGGGRHPPPGPPPALGPPPPPPPPDPP